MTPTDMIDTIHGTGVTAQAGELAALILQLGRDEMAQVLQGFALDSTDEADEYRDGIQDALNMLVQAGATDPR